MAEVRISFDLTEAEKMIAEHINENAEMIAKQIAADAKAAVNVVTGNLRKGIRAKKSKYEDGGWIVQSTAPHAHLVEFGTGPRVLEEPRKVSIGGRVAVITHTGTMPPKAYLRPALDKNIEAAKAAFGVK